VAKLKEEGLEVQLGLLDIEDETSIKQFAAVVAEKYSPVSILINNAGFAFKVSFPILQCHHQLTKASECCHRDSV
jgi:short-subunit dehydrogenase involved in D-alanine esterification of teichoic acids